MSQSFPLQIGHLIQKMSSTDKDFRFMATNDLLIELQKDSIKLDDEAEKRVVNVLLVLLKDSNAEVQNLAVKCMGPLIKKAKETHVDYIVNTLCENMISSDEVLKETSSIALKTLIHELQPEANRLAVPLCKRINAHLLLPLTTTPNVSMQLEGLEIFSEMLSRYGSYMLVYYPSIVKAITPLLESSRPAVCKRTISCFGYISINCPTSMFDNIVSYLINGLETKQNDLQRLKVYINCIITMCRSSGLRMSTHLKPIFEIISKFININDDEMKETCLLLLEAFLRKCTKECSPYITEIVQVSLKYLTYDPNYNYDDENDDEDMEMDNCGEEDNDSDDDYSDDDDMSWKVRRASAKILDAAIITREDKLAEFYSTIGPGLINQFKEREENVKVEIFHAYSKLLRQTRNVSNAALRSKHLETLRAQVPQIVRALEKQLKEKSIKTRQCVFSLLGEIVSILPDALADPGDLQNQKRNFLNNIIPGILYSLNSNNATSSMKVEALTFLNLLLTTHTPVVFRNYFNALITEINKAANDSFYKITSEALSVLTLIIPIIRPTMDMETDATTMGYVGSIYAITSAKLKTADIDQEVKDRAITCMAQIVCYFGDQIQDRLGEIFTLFLERLKNEVTRLTCVKAMNKILCTRFAKPLDLSFFFPEAFPLLAAFLRQNKRNLKVNTLLLLENISKHYSSYMTQEINEKILLQEVVPLLSESDLHISILTLNVVTSMILSHKAFSDIIPKIFLPQALLLIRSPLLQGSTLEAMVRFLSAIVQSSFPGLDSRELVSRLTQPIISSGGNNPLHRQSFHSISKCIASIVLPDEKLAFQIAQQLIEQVEKPSLLPNALPEYVQLYSLLTIGEVGKKMDLAPLERELREAIDIAFRSSAEEVKSAASIALGSVVVANLEFFLPFVMSEIVKANRQQYLLLCALKETIKTSSHKGDSIQLIEPHLATIWSLLEQCAMSEEDGTRYVAAECLGKLTHLKPDELLPKVVAFLGSPSWCVREVGVNAIRFTLTDKPHAIDDLLKDHMDKLMYIMRDDNIDVRRLSLLTFNSILHNKPMLVRNSFDLFLELLYGETQVKSHLIREVEMGPFKHVVDDGLDLRKAAFECMYTLLDSCLDKIDIDVYLACILKGLGDNYDIKMMNFLILIRLADLYPTAVLHNLKAIASFLRETITTKVKANSVKQEFEKQDELKRSAIRAFNIIYQIAGADKEDAAYDLWTEIMGNEDLKPLYDSVVANARKDPLKELSAMEVEY